MLKVMAAELVTSALAGLSIIGAIGWVALVAWFATHEGGDGE